MLVEERKARLLAQLAAGGRIVARDAAEALGLSEDTIRRDLRELAAEGRLKRVHGGALPVSPALAPFAARLPIRDAEKAAVGRAAAALVEPGQLVFLDGGTTALQVAQQLRPGLRATVLTHSPNVALALMAHDGLQIELLGGRLYRHSVVTTGAATLAWLESYRPDLALIGATGLHPEHGLTTGDSEEAAVKRAVIARSGAAWVLASPEKIGAVSSHVIAPVTAVEGVLTTRAADPAIRAALGCRVVLAD